MFTRTIPLFSMFGFQIKLDLSWFFLAILLTWTLSFGLFPSMFPHLAYATYLWMSVSVVLGLFASIVLHEFAHAWVANRFGLPMRGITLFIFGGMAEMDEESPSPIAEFWMALAGPATSLLILFACFALYLLGMLRGWPVWFIGVIGYLAIMNGMLILFNMVPAFPLDGGRVLRAMLWAWKKNLNWATRITARLGGWFGLFLIFMGILSVMRGELIGGLWWVFIGVFLRQAATSSCQQMLMRQQLEGASVARFMQTDVISVPPSITLQELVEQYFYVFYFKGYPVVEADRLVGYVSLPSVQDMSPAEWTNHTVSEIMKPLTPENSISPNTDAREALARMGKSGHSRLMVTDGGKLVGILSLSDLLRYFSMRTALEAPQ